MKPSAARQAVAAALLLGTGVLAAACGSATQGTAGQPTATDSPHATKSAPPPSSPATPSPSPSPTAAAAAAGCPSSGLKVKVAVSQAGGAAGSAYYPIDFTNVSGGTCTLYGYPGVSFSSGPGGSQIGNAANRNPAGAPVMVTLAAGAVAHATVQIAQAANYPQAACKPVTAHWLKIYPPNQFKPLFVPFTTQACSGNLHHGDGSQLSIYAVRAGAGKRGQAP
jgi:hypothetical protein